MRAPQVDEANPSLGKVWVDHQDFSFEKLIDAPHGPVGRRLWVRETYAVLTGNGRRVVYRADYQDGRDPRTGWDDVPVDRRPAMKWAPSTRLSRAWSRITLEVTRVRAEYVQDVTEEDAKAEGVPSWAEQRTSIGVDQTLTTGERMLDSPYRASYAVRWDELNGNRANWKSNPVVWVYDFRVADLQESGRS